jgi:hypothetical protein
MGVPAPMQDTRDVKPTIDEGQEEWADMMRGNMNAKKGDDWLEKGKKAVQVGNEMG